MSTLIQQLYSQNHWIADGSQTVWDFTFAGNDTSLTYLSRDHVKAYWIDDSGNRQEYVFGDADWLGDYQLQVIPAPPAGKEFVIYRDTPKDKPWVDYADGAAVTEISLDDTAKQAVFIAAETLDNSGLYPDLGFKALKHVPYTGASVLAVLDNGRSHYKTDATGITVPDTLPIEYLTTIINDHPTASLTVTMDGSQVAHRQGLADTAGIATWTVPARNTCSLTFVSTGHWYVNGTVVP